MVPLAEVEIAVIGLGYVGLPLAVEFGKKFVTVGYDINSRRLSELAANVDRCVFPNKLGLDSTITSWGPNNQFIVSV